MECRVEVARDLAACALTAPISREVWGEDARVPPELLLASVENGGFVGIGDVAGDHG